MAEAEAKVPKQEAASCGLVVGGFSSSCLFSSSFSAGTSLIRNGGKATPVIGVAFHFAATR